MGWRNAYGQDGVARVLTFAVINLRQDLHLQECARAGRTKKKAAEAAISNYEFDFDFILTSGCGVV